MLRPRFEGRDRSQTALATQAPVESDSIGKGGAYPRLGSRSNSPFKAV